MTDTIDWSVFTGHSDLLARTADEMQRQVKKWKAVNGHAHPLLHGKPADRVGVQTTYSALERFAQAKNATLAVDGDLGWDTILLEEVYEALKEDDADKAVEELVQSAAVALSAAYSIQRYGLGGKQVLG